MYYFLVFFNTIIQKKIRPLSVYLTIDNNTHIYILTKNKVLCTENLKIS